MNGIEPRANWQELSKSSHRCNGGTGSALSGELDHPALTLDRIEGYAEPTPSAASSLSLAQSPNCVDVKLLPSSLAPVSRPSRTRRLAAIFVSDVFEFSKLFAMDEGRTLVDLGRDRRERIEPAIHHHGGRIIKFLGDEILVVFGSVVDAVECALDIQNAPRGCGASLPLRIGINLCDVILEDGDIYGHGVNIAFRIERMAPPGGICITSSVHETVASLVNAEFSNIGECHLKNISRSVHLFAWSHEAASEGAEAACRSLTPSGHHQLSDSAGFS